MPLSTRLPHHAAAWRLLTPPRYVLQLLERGLTLEWLDGKPPPLHSASAAPRRGASDALRAELETWARTGVVRRVSPSDSDGYYSPIFAIAKKSGGQRLIYDGRSINEYIRRRHFKMEQLGDALRLLRQPGAFMAKIDISSAFHHVPLAPETRRYTRFLVDNDSYEYLVMPMGLSTSPRLFTKLMKPVMAALRGEGVCATIYIDDMLITAETAEACAAATRRAADLLTSLGLQISLDKSSVEPATRVEYLGFVIDTSTMRVSLPEAKRAALVTSIKEVKRRDRARCLRIRHVASVGGALQQLRPVRQRALAETRSLQRARNAALRDNRGNWDAPMALDPATIDELDRWSAWLAPRSEPHSLPIFMPAAMTITSDASRVGWGAQTGSLSAAGRWAPRQAARSSNWRELKALLYALRSFVRPGPNPPGAILRRITMRTDNTVAASYVNKQGGRSPVLTRIAAKAWLYAEQCGVVLRAVHVPGAQISSVDALSRPGRDRTDWQLDPALFQRACRHFRHIIRPTVDWFATRLNRQLPRYVSRLYDPSATAVDAFQQDWRREDGWINPPFPLISVILDRLDRLGARALVVLPTWRSAAWWPLAQAMAIAPPFRLPRRHDTFRPAATANSAGIGPPHFETAVYALQGRAQPPPPATAPGSSPTALSPRSSRTPPTQPPASTTAPAATTRTTADRL